VSRTTTIVDQLDTFGPGRCDTLSREQARSWCGRLARSQYENFSVLSSLVPADRRDDFAAVYAFCRWADDLGDETGGTGRGRELLDWWRRELEQCFEGSPRHPVFIALEPTIRTYGLEAQPFLDLIDAFQQDQEITRYERWDQLIDYCRRSANPVGRLVLRLCGEPEDEVSLRHSDELCTALQLVNHWQDVRRDILDRDRVYIPRELIEIDDFERPLFETGAALLDRIGPTTRPIVWLLAAGGQHVLHLIERWNYETVLHRPRLSKTSRLLLVARAHLLARRGARRAGPRREPARGSDA
jgi:phytoene/squalene synthetase